MTESFDYTVKYKQQERTGSITLNLSSTIDFLKKKLLRKFNYLASNIEKITIYLIIRMGSNNKILYPVPLLNSSDMYELIKRELDGGRSVEITFESEEDLVSTTRQKKTAKVEFDSQGEVQSIDSEFEFVIPSDPIYNGKTAVICAFCQRSSTEKEFVRLNGSFFGPFSRKYYCHLLCALWAPKVFLPKKSGKLHNIVSEIQRGRRMYCYYCGKKGGVLGCSNQKCKVSAHFDCAQQRGCELEWNQYTMLCKKCIGKNLKKQEPQN